MDDVCYYCGKPATDTHHVFNGPMRQKSEEYGATMRLCRKCHEEVHKSAQLRLLLKKAYQAQIMAEYKMSEDEFRQIFHKSYLFTKE